MNDMDLASAIDHLAESTRALNRLRRMREQDLQLLLELISDDAALQSLRRLLHTVRELQRTTRWRELDRAQRKQLKRRPPDPEFESTLSSVLSDRERFPTVPAVARFVSEVFGVKVPPQKDSRDRYVRKVIRAVTSSPRALHNARNAIAHGEVDSRDRAYTLLYDFIRGRLTD